MADETAAGPAPAETVSAEPRQVAARLFRSRPPLGVEAAKAAGLKLFFVTEEAPDAEEEQRGFLIWGLTPFDACQLAQRALHLQDAPPLWATELQPLDMAPRYAEALVDELDDSDFNEILTFRIRGDENWLLLGDWEDDDGLIAPHGDADFKSSVKTLLQERLTEFFRQFLDEFPDALEQSAEAVEGDAYRWDGPPLPVEAGPDSGPGTQDAAPEVQP